MKKMYPDLKKHSRTYVIPILATMAVLAFWFYYGDYSHWWWPVLIGGILIVHIWAAYKGKK